jgi:ABC-type sulfate transport system substrate-binding protein
VPVLDTGARGSTTTFVAARHRRRAARVGERGLPRRRRNSASDKFEIVAPSLQHPRRAFRQRRHRQCQEARHHRSCRWAAYLRYLDTPEAQTAIRAQLLPPARSGHRTAVQAQFPNPDGYHRQGLRGWAKAQKTFFDDGGVFDRITAKK